MDKRASLEVDALRERKNSSLGFVRPGHKRGEFLDDEVVFSKRSWFFLSVFVTNSEGKILENCTLEVALNFWVFQGLTLKKPCIKSIDFSLKLIPWPWKCCPWSCLDFQGFSRLNLEKPWLPKSNFCLPWPWIENSNILSRTLKTLDSTSMSHKSVTVATEPTQNRDVMRNFNLWVPAIVSVFV